MEHFRFKLFATISAAIMAVLYSLYLMYNLRGKSMVSKLLLKVSITTTLLLLNTSYFLLYRITFYSLLMLVTLFLSLLGDIFMEFVKDNHVFLILGGGSFLAGRVVLTLNLWCQPDEYFHFIKYNRGKILIVASIIYVPFIFFCIYLAIYSPTKLTVVVVIYILVGICPNLLLSFMRIQSGTDETVSSQLLAFLGIVLYNISDVILFVTFYVKLASWVDLFSNGLYWLGLYLLTISIVRNGIEAVERYGIFELPTYMANSQAYLDFI